MFKRGPTIVAPNLNVFVFDDANAIVIEITDSIVSTSVGQSIVDLVDPILVRLFKQSGHQVSVIMNWVSVVKYEDAARTCIMEWCRSRKIMFGACAVSLSPRASVFF